MVGVKFSSLTMSSDLRLVLVRSIPGVVCAAKSAELKMLACWLLFSSSLYPKEMGPEDLWEDKSFI